MAEAVTRTPDTPDNPILDTYPAPVPESDSQNDRLNETAEQIGLTVGRAVRNVRELPERLAALKDRFTVIRGGGRRAAGEKAQELQDAARERAERTRRRIESLANEYPVQVILGVAGVAFLVGVGLRVWRANRG